MAVTPETSVLTLVDTSAWARLHQPAVAAALSPLVAEDAVGFSVITRLELLHCAQSGNDWDRRNAAFSHFFVVTVPDDAQARAVEVQGRLWRAGRVRSVGLADLLLAATAEMLGLTVIHYDRDFDQISTVTGQSTRWVVQPGSVP